MIRQQTQLRQDYAWPYHLMAVVSLLTLFLGNSSKGRPLLLLVVLGGAVLFWFSIWLHKQECQVYHRNILRYEPPR
jgi:hypothetical protein